MARAPLIASITLAVATGITPARADDRASDHAIPEAPCQLGDEGCFLDRDGTLREADAAYRALHWRPEPHYLRAGLEMAALLGVGTVWYWVDRERQVADWDYPSLKQRFSLDVIRYDNNDFWINFIAHPLDGAAFHAFSRANHLSLAESFGYGMLTSLAWEYALEFREKVSLNDIIVTPAAGLTIGEFTHRLGQLLNARRRSGEARWWHDLAAWTVGSPVAVHDWLDTPRAAHAGSLLPGSQAHSDIWHDIRVSYGWTVADVNGAAQDSFHSLRLDGRLVAIPGYLRPGRLQRAFADADLTSLRLDIDFGARGSGVDVYADTVLLGFHTQRISSQGTGAALTVGTSLGYRYLDETREPWKDQLGIAHLPGLAVEAHLTGRHAALRAYARLHGDFAGLRAHPYAAWEAENPDIVGKNILRKQGYYYGWGWSGRVGAALVSPYVEVGGELFYGHYDSHEGLDRTQETVEYDVEAASTVRDYELRLRLHHAAWPLYAELATLSRHRQSRVDTYQQALGYERLLLRLGMQF